MSQNLLDIFRKDSFLKLRSESFEYFLGEHAIPWLVRMIHIKEPKIIVEYLIFPKRINCWNFDPNGHFSNDSLFIEEDIIEKYLP